MIVGMNKQCFLIYNKPKTSLKITCDLINTRHDNVKKQLHISGEFLNINQLIGINEIEIYSAKAINTEIGYNK